MATPWASQFAIFYARQSRIMRTLHGYVKWDLVIIYRIQVTYTNNPNPWYANRSKCHFAIYLSSH